MENKQNILQNYLQLLTNLKRDNKSGGAPHKPILMLSIIDCIENKFINSSKIYITPELVSVFKQNWSRYVITARKPDFAMPFYHLTTASFWKLIDIILETYKVVVSKYFDEDQTNAYSLRKLEGKKIKLPFGKNFYPNVEFLRWHGEVVLKG